MSVDYSEFFPIKEYYEKVVMPLNSKFRKVKRGMYLCCLHDDTDPSLGILKSRKGREVFHCFGCNSWGNIIDLHKKVSLKYKGKNLSEEDCKRELCKIFDLDYGKLPSEDSSLEKVSLDRSIERSKALKDAISRFTLADFRNSFIEGKLEKKSISYFNSLLIKLINERGKDS